MRQLNLFNRCKGKWRDFAKPLVLLTVVSMLITALFFLSCATSRKTEVTKQEAFSQSIADSIVSETRLKTVEKVPMSEVEMEIPMQNLLKLPDRAEYRAKSGQAGASVRVENDTVFVSATCDSLQIMCDYYESLYINYKQGYDDLQSQYKNEVKKSPNTIRTAFVSFFAGLVIGVLLTIIVKLKFRIL